MFVSEFDKTFDYNDNDIVPNNCCLMGKFKKYLQYDLEVLKIFDIQINFFTLNLPLTDKFWKHVKLLCHPNHTDNTFEQSILIVKFIYLYGWTEFMIFMENYIVKKNI